MKEDRLQERRIELLLEEQIENRIQTLWLSFVHPDKPEDQRFAGVIITKALGLIHAIEHINLLGINPHGEILCYEIEEVKPEYLDKVLYEDDLRKAGYIK